VPEGFLPIHTLFQDTGKIAPVGPPSWLKIHDDKSFSSSCQVKNTRGSLLWIP